MRLKKEITDKKDYQISKKNDLTMDAKKELLPLLKNIEALTKQRDNYSEKINLIDEELEKVKNNILSIKVSYEKDISDLKNNINFFEQSITLINNIKGEK
jgi:peptidoglycan hydrolase CwlO-like protein